MLVVELTSLIPTIYNIFSTDTLQFSLIGSVLVHFLVHTIYRNARTHKVWQAFYTNHLHTIPPSWKFRHKPAIHRCHEWNFIAIQWTPEQSTDLFNSAPKEWITTEFLPILKKSKISVDCKSLGLAKYPSQLLTTNPNCQ